MKVHDPMYSDEELEAFGWEPYHEGESAAAAIIQADHKEYAELTPADVPGVKVLFDGRSVTDPQKWDGVPRLTIG